jgi:hypothetical protein
MFWQPMRKLMAKARRKREENMQIQLMEEEPQNGCMPCTTDDNGPLVQPISSDSTMNNTINTNPSSTAASAPPINFAPSPQPTRASDQNHLYNNLDLMVPPQIVGMGMLAPEQIQLQLQQQQMQTQQQTPWLMDDNALLDLDMNALDDDANWQGWEDLVRDFQAAPNPDARVNALGSVGNWW